VSGLETKALNGVERVNSMPWVGGTSGITTSIITNFLGICTILTTRYLIIPKHWTLLESNEYRSL